MLVMMSKLSKQRQQHANDRGNGISHLWSRLLPDPYRGAVRIVIAIRYVVGGVRIAFLHCMHGDIPKPA